MISIQFDYTFTPCNYIICNNNLRCLRISLSYRHYIIVIFQVKLGIHDNLYARVIIIELEEKYLLIQLDLLSIDEEYANFLIDNLNTKYCIKRENVFISCIHTHSSPASVVVRDNLEAMDFVDCKFLDNPLLSDYFLKQISWSVGEACKNLSGFKFSSRRSALHGVGLNRGSPVIPIDDELQVLIFNLDNGKK